MADKFEGEVGVQSTMTLIQVAGELCKYDSRAYPDKDPQFARIIDKARIYLELVFDKEIAKLS